MTEDVFEIEGHDREPDASAPDVPEADAMASIDPVVGLGAVGALQRLQQRLEAIHVHNAREQGWSWQDIADALGVSRQAVHQKHNRNRR